MNINLKLFAAQGIALFALFALSLFLPAGTLDWAVGWIYLVLFFVFYLGVSAWLFKHNPGLLQERMQMSQPNQKGWDKLLFPVLLVLPFVWLIFISLDAVRFHWSPLPIWLQTIGLVALLTSFLLFFLVFRENSFLSTVVRIQKERGHAVISSGPYHYVRHPMYSAFLIYMTATPLFLGSGYGVVLGLLFMFVLARRAVMEENTLRDELPGYLDYMGQVKYRLVPYIW